MDDVNIFDKRFTQQYNLLKKIMTRMMKIKIYTSFRHWHNVVFLSGLSKVKMREALLESQRENLSSTLAERAEELRTALERADAWEGKNAAATVEICTSGSSARQAKIAGSPTLVAPAIASPRPPATGPVGWASAQEQLLFWFPNFASITEYSLHFRSMIFFLSANDTYFKPDANPVGKSVVTNLHTYCPVYNSENEIESAISKFTNVDLDGKEGYLLIAAPST